MIGQMRWGLAVLLAAVAGCGAVQNILSSGSQTSIRLVNEADYPVDVVLYYGKRQETPQAVLKNTGTRMQWRLSPGETASLARKCDALQAVMIDNADLDVALGLGPNADTGVFRDGSDFHCGDTLVFTFRNTGVTKLNIDFRVE
jgi:hypothetical protein